MDLNFVLVHNAQNAVVVGVEFNFLHLPISQKNTVFLPFLNLFLFNIDYDNLIFRNTTGHCQILPVQGQFHCLDLQHANVVHREATLFLVQVIKTYDRIFSIIGQYDHSSLMVSGESLIASASRISNIEGWGTVGLGFVGWPC